MIKNEKLKWINVFLWLASVAAMLGVMLLGGQFIYEDNVGMLIEFAIIAVVTLLFLYLISGKKTFSFMNNRLGYTVLMLLPTLAFSALFGLASTWEVIEKKPALLDNWPVSFLIAALTMFLVGIYEEGCFRACACDALLPLLKKTKHPFFLTALISGLLFGYVHVVFVDFSSFQQTLQFILKIANLAFAGAAFMILYWKTRNLLGIAIIHGLNDLLPDYVSSIFVSEEASSAGSYTSGNVGTTVIYLIQLVFVIAAFIFVYIKVGKTIDYKKTLEEW